MNVTPEEVKHLPLSDKERHHPSRTRQGYHVFISYFNLIFKDTEPFNQREMLHHAGLNFDNEDDVIPYQLIYQLARQEWRMLSRQQVLAWDERARMLNSRPTVSQTINYPYAVRMDIIQLSLYYDYMFIYNTLKRYQ